ncbi:PAS domain-containing protein [Desulfomicrobium salsuginis]
MKKRPDEQAADTTSLRDKIVGLSESSGRKSYYPMLQQKIRELQNEISERWRAENTLRQTLARISRQQAVMAEISTDPNVFHGRLRDAAPMITVKMSHALEVSRTGLWIRQGERFICLDKFDARYDAHSSGQILKLEEFPTYHAAIVREVVAVDNVHTDPRTMAFASSYLAPHGIESMLDVPVQIEGEIAGIISFEHTASPRAWQPDEITFAGRVADQVALIMENKRRRMAEERLREAHAELTRNFRFTEVLLDAIPIPLFYKDSSLRYLGCNRAFTEVMGVSREELQGKTTRDLWPDLSTTYEENDHSLLRGAPRSTYEAKVRGKDGQLREVIFAKQVFFDERNRTDGIIGSFVDITERIRSEKESQRLRTLLSNIINSMPSMLIGVDADGRIAQWNQQAARVTGVSEEEARGKPLGEIVPWLEPEMRRIRQSIADKKPFFEGKLRRIVDGETHFEDVTIYPLISNGVEGAVIRIDDVTDKVRIEDVLVQSEKMLSVGGLAAGMAHEINNPLASIMGNAQVLETRLTHPPAAERGRGTGRRHLDGGPAHVPRVAGNSENAPVHPQLRGPGGADRQQHAQLQPQERRDPCPGGHHRHRGQDPGTGQYGLQPEKELRLQENTDYQRVRTRPAQNSGLRKQAAAGLPESVPERSRGHGGEEISRRAGTTLHPAGAEQPALGADRTGG